VDASILTNLFHIGPDAHTSVSVLEKIIRPVLVYLFLVVGLRLAGKRELAQLNAFDLVVLAVGEAADLSFLEGTELAGDAASAAGARIPVNFAGATHQAGVFACGDAAFGQGTVTQAIATGRRAAELAAEYMEKNATRKP